MQFVQSAAAFSGKNIAAVAEAFKVEDHLLPIKTQAICESLERGLAILALAGEDAVGFSRLIPLVDNWYELGSTWVHKDWRGRNLNKQMYQEFLPGHVDKNILATTTNPVSVAVGESLGFVHIARKSLPECVWRATCICPAAKTRVNDNTQCTLAAFESFAAKQPCLTRITAQTWLRRTQWLR